MSKKEKKNPFFPCMMVQHENYMSIICSEFHYFDEYFAGNEGGGYALQRLAKKIAKEKGISQLKYDSEAGMFCAYSPNEESLLALCRELRTITGEEEKYLPEAGAKPKISEEKATELLLRGFVMDLNFDAQQEFLANVPLPPMTSAQKGYILALEKGEEAEILLALNKISSEARTKVRKLNHYLSHPDTISAFLKLNEREISDKVRVNLVNTLMHICSRHFPDLRCRELFYQHLISKKADLRLWALEGLRELYSYEMEKIQPFLHDKSDKVKQKAELMCNKGQLKDRNTEDIFPSWMFEIEIVQKIKEELEKTKSF